MGRQGTGPAQRPQESCCWHAVQSHLPGHLSHCGHSGPLGQSLTSGCPCDGYRACWPIAARPTKAGEEKDKTLRSPSEACPQTSGLTSSDGPPPPPQASPAPPRLSPLRLRCTSPQASLSGHDTLGDLHVAFAETWVCVLAGRWLGSCRKGSAVRVLVVAKWIEVSCPFTQQGAR